MKSWQKKVLAIKIVIPKSGWRRTKPIIIMKETKVAVKKYFFPFMDWAMPQEDSIIKKGLITSEGWNEKLNIFNHLLAPFTWYSEKNKVIKSKVIIIKPNKANLLIFLLDCCDRKIIITTLKKKTLWRFKNKKFWFTE